jgi:glycerol-3-phosphate acyltransferase PlsX
MGSDTKPSELLDAIYDFIQKPSPFVHLTLFGTSDVLAGKHSPSPHVALHVVQEYISMDEAPLAAIRNKKQSSISVGIRMLKEKHLHAFVSAGNTGALMSIAKLSLPMLPSIGRPALLTLLPTIHQNHIAVLDVGANTSCKSHHLVEFALIGAAFQKVRGIRVPKVGLLNIGSEAKKGTPQLREAYSYLKKSDPYHLEFVGNIEARDVFQGSIDVLVTDGFTGNIFLKTAEGIGHVILNQIEEITQQGSFLDIKQVLIEMRRRLHYTEYPGALLCGVDGIVMKCHGNSSSQSLINTINCAISLVKHDFIEKAKTYLDRS